MKNRNYRIGIGASSILLIFLVLSLTTLGVLALSSARTDWRLTQNQYEMTKSIYAAQAEAEKMIGEIDTALAQAEEKASDDGEYSALTEKITVKGYELIIEGGSISFEIPVAEKQLLRVSLQLAQRGAHPRYRIETFSFGLTGEWNVKEEPMNLM